MSVFKLVGTGFIRLCGFFAQRHSSIFFQGGGLFFEWIFAGEFAVYCLLNFGNGFALLLHARCDHCLICADLAVGAVHRREAIEQRGVLVGFIAPAIAEQFGNYFGALLRGLVANGRLTEELTWWQNGLRYTRNRVRCFTCLGDFAPLRPGYGAANSQRNCQTAKYCFHSRVHSMIPTGMSVLLRNSRRLCGGLAQLCKHEQARNRLCLI